MANTKEEMIAETIINKPAPTKPAPTKLKKK